MINELLFMNGYGVYVLSAFSFTLLSFSALYLITKVQFIKEQNKFVAKFGSLNSEKAEAAKSQRINKEILANATNN
ncbi:heme exporter protein CcmD [Candidatus Pelagibacter ubique]|jgi:heme exporter protein D|uniref:heme exporter protein CcmD n=1 Tax=Pelagibacter ubique TaxID=198252 RepID=UPI0003C7FC81